MLESVGLMAIRGVQVVSMWDRLVQPCNINMLTTPRPPYTKTNLEVDIQVFDTVPLMGLV